MISKILKNVGSFLLLFCILISFAFVPFQVPEEGQTYKHVPNQFGLFACGGFWLVVWFSFFWEKGFIWFCFFLVLVGWLFGGVGFGFVFPLVGFLFMFWVGFFVGFVCLFLLFFGFLLYL